MKIDSSRIGMESARSYASIASVTPCMGVWIEITGVSNLILLYVVTPCMGVTGEVSKRT